MLGFSKNVFNLVVYLYFDIESVYDALNKFEIKYLLLSPKFKRFGIFLKSEDSSKHH